jgi:hypothetical protein
MADKMKPLFSFALAAVLLAGCMSRATQPGGDFALAPEKLVFLALKAAAARDEQRLKVMEAYDDTRPKLKALYEEGQDLIEDWRKLDRNKPEFRPKAEKIGVRLGEIARERVATMAVYEARVAGILELEQWYIWQNFWDDLVRAQEPRRR